MVVICRFIDASMKNMFIHHPKRQKRYSWKSVSFQKGWCRFCSLTSFFIFVVQMKLCFFIGPFLTVIVFRLVDAYHLDGVHLKTIVQLLFLTLMNYDFSAWWAINTIYLQCGRLSNYLSIYVWIINSHHLLDELCHDEALLSI